MAAMSQYATSTAQTAKLEQALAAHRQGQLDTAAALYRDILTGNPSHFDSLHLLGVIEMQRGDAAQAVEFIGKAVQVNKKNAGAYSNLGLALRDLRRFEEALSACNKAVAVQVDNALAQYNRALILLDLERHEQALAGFRKALQINPNMPEAHTNMGVTLQAMGRFEEALASFTKARDLLPGDATALHNIGSVDQLLGRHDDARKAFEGAIACQPDHAEAHVGLSECLLQSGAYTEGWREYEWRWKVASIAPLKRNFAQPSWTGQEDIAGKTILIHAEQGLGDTLQFARYIGPLRARGARVILEVQPALKTLFAAQAVDVPVLAKDEVLPAFDMHCPLMSLPMALGMGGDFAAAPYIQAPAAAIDKWRARLGSADKKRCGVVWSGAEIKRGSGRYRSIDLQTFKRIADGGVELIGLQHMVRDGDTAALAAFPEVNNLGPELQDFADTAGLIANLDLVIAVDTAVAHLAGAMGKPLWLLLAHAPDWRWDINPGNGTVWYPSARVFRQPALFDWAAVLDHVAAALKAGR